MCVCYVIYFWFYGRHYVSLQYTLWWHNTALAVLLHCHACPNTPCCMVFSNAMSLTMVGAMTRLVFHVRGARAVYVFLFVNRCGAVFSTQY